MRKIFFVPTLLIGLSSSVFQTVNALTPNQVETIYSSNASLNAPVMSKPPIQVVQSVGIGKPIRQLKMNRRLWNRQKISNYSYTLSRSCFCTPEAREPVVIKVRNGKRASITNAATGQPVNPELFQQYDTIPKLFNFINDAIAKKASSLTVEYKPELGYPTQINIDYDSQQADEEVFLTIENLTISP